LPVPTSEANIFATSSAFQARVTFFRWAAASIFFRASAPMKSWSNFTKDPYPSWKGLR